MPRDLSGLLGHRVSLRRRLADGGAGDVVGVLTASTPQVRIQPEWAPEARLDPADVIAVRAVPDPVIRPSSAIPKLAWVMDQGRPGPERERLGGWVLRRGDGSGGPADSVLLLGDPGLPVPPAVDAAETWYRRRGLPPLFQLDRPSPGSPREHPCPQVDAELTARGYRTRADVLVLVTQLVPVTQLPGALPPGPEVVWTPGPCTLSASLPGPDGRPVAGARLAVAHAWAGVSAFTVDSGHRRAGLGAALLAAVLRRARELGARYGYVQVERPNEPALRLCRGAGFTEHHGFRLQEGELFGP